MAERAVVLLSGGMDSSTCLAIASDVGYDCYAMSFDYGQKNVAELAAAKVIAQHFAVNAHRMVDLSFLQQLGHSALTEAAIAVPDYQETGEIPPTYVPARNTIFLSLALAWAEVLGAKNIFIGVSAIDYSGYPDCRPAYIAAYQKMANLATKFAVEGQHLNIHTPLIHLSKAETIKKGVALGVDYSMTVTCYQADQHGSACGRCDSCMLRKHGFEEAGVGDNTRYY